MGFQNPIVGGTALRIPAIQSPNYSPGVSGWIIKIDGSAEFNNLTVRGTFTGADFIINSAGIFLYSSAPAAGNLIGSWASVAGTDAFGNTYPAGIGQFGSLGLIQFFSRSVHESTPSQIKSGVANVGLPAEFIAFLLEGPSITTYNDRVRLQLNSQAEDGSSYANIQLVTDLGGGGSTLVASFDKARINTAVPVIKANAVWNAPVMGTGWANGPGGGTVQPCEYRLDAEDNLIIVGTLHTTSTTPAAACFTLPVGFRPAITQRSPSIINSGGTVASRFVEVNSSGAVSVMQALVASGVDVYFQVSVPMGNIT